MVEVIGFVLMMKATYSPALDVPYAGERVIYQNRVECEEAKTLFNFHTPKNPEYGTALYCFPVIQRKSNG